MEIVCHVQHNEYLRDQIEHSYFGSTTRTDYSQMNSRMIADIIKNKLRENLKMIIKIARGLVK
jgi:hypothetical protein